MTNREIIKQFETLRSLNAPLKIARALGNYLLIHQINSSGFSATVRIPLAEIDNEASPKVQAQSLTLLIETITGMGLELDILEEAFNTAYQEVYYDFTRSGDIDWDED